DAVAHDLGECRQQSDAPRGLGLSGLPVDHVGLSYAACRGPFPQGRDPRHTLVDRLPHERKGATRGGFYPADAECPTDCNRDTRVDRTYRLLPDWPHRGVVSSPLNGSSYFFEIVRNLVPRTRTVISHGTSSVRSQKRGCICI